MHTNGTILAGVSAGSLCWHVGGTTDSFGPELRAVTDGLALLPFDNGVHLDSEPARRPTVHRLVRDGVMSVEDVDACVKDGLGLRWSFMGPFETIDLNAPGGVADYVARFGPLMGGITEEQAPYRYDAPTVTQVTGARRGVLAAEAIADRSAWRDRRLMALAAHKKGQPG